MSRELTPRHPSTVPDGVLLDGITGSQPGPVPIRCWNGRGASAGVREGNAHVIRTERDFATFVPGRILVLRHATPDAFPALLGASATICETGGLCCHLAVLAREVGTPCVTGASGITDMVATGDLLRVDGAEGIVQVLGNEPPSAMQVGVAAHRPTWPPPRDGSVPVVQFGRFSGAFQLLDASIDVDTALRIAALVTIPCAFSLGQPWDFEFVGNQVLVDAATMDRTVTQLADRLEAADLLAAAWRARAEDVSRPEPWTALADSQPAEIVLGQALRDYVELNQLTWASIVTKEPLVDRYRQFLEDALPDVEPAWLRDRFLDSIVLPGHSYILRLWGEQAPPAESLADPPATELGRPGHRRRTSLEQLEEALPPYRRARFRHYVETLGALVDLSERKNTDLARCGQALFSSAERERAIAVRLRIDRELGTSAPSASGDRRVVEHIVRRLVDDSC